MRQHPACPAASQSESRLPGMHGSFRFVSDVRLRGSNPNDGLAHESVRHGGHSVPPRRSRLIWSDPSYQELLLSSSDSPPLRSRVAQVKHLYPELTSKEWKHWWAVTEAVRLRLRVEIDALCADLYGLDPDDFDWIVRDDPTDPKGFYRLDRKLPFRERLTGLAATAFRALKEGKWSGESAASLRNDEFFEILGIPELTNAQAAHARGLSGPLIAKRDGCHVWKPENFPEDDPCHGWTWDDCWNDAVALLGSEEAVQEYLRCPQGNKEEVLEDTAPKDLFGNPLPVKPKQRKLAFGDEAR